MAGIGMKMVLDRFAQRPNDMRLIRLFLSGALSQWILIAVPRVAYPHSRAKEAA